jgi:hypothetical protein
MIPIRKGMPMSSATTKALPAVETVTACMKEGRNYFEDENKQKSTVEDHTTEDQERQILVHEARDKELAQAAVEGRLCVVTANADKVKSADQARAFGWTLLLWCAQRSTVEKTLLDDMVAPELRTPEHLLRGFKSILHPMPYKHSVGIARTDLSSWGSTWLVVRTNFPKGNLPRTS